ncbi:DsrE family protein [Pseudorhodoferax sp. Leaf267]|uniref:DsrE family protein n=1 Tax=Pseudorhodoferax sp. Leaf267 TaxID=1736316 RepID=UPI0006F3A4F5|nr:DsrE family protein [Pseudorhodoferax sp. Leaf267]KQP15152.1 hypothetical protein ASF43_14090 [Pseudorhodoferax sp. Leaf267]
MHRRVFMQAAALAALTLAAGPLLAQPAAPRKLRVVVQVSDNDPARWNLALNNVRNLQEDVGAANVEVEIVAYGPGIAMLKLESPVASRIADAGKAGTRVLACENTMKALKLVRDDMAGGIGYVPAGVTTIVTRQSEGWAYLRP